MDLIHSLSNLEIETHHPHSSSSKKEVEDEVRRIWAELPADVMSLILLKLGHVDILRHAQWVCTSWWKLSKQPHLFRSIHVIHGKHSFQMAREAIDRSCGQLVKFSSQEIANNKLLHYMSEKSRSLRCIRLLSCYAVSDDGLIEMAKKLPQLEELEIIDRSSCISKNVFETFGRFCPRLNSFQLNYLPDTLLTVTGFDRGLGLAIAENMPELHHLNLFAYMLTDNDLRAILDGCPQLESLDLRSCYGLKFAGDLKERCGRVKVFKGFSD